MNTPSIGTWLSLPNESIAEIFSNAGYEWVVIDLEHSSISISQAESLIRTIDLAGSKPFIRLSGHDPSQIKRVLDAGAKGILAPMIENAQQIKTVIDACHYPPVGNRGMGLARAQGYGTEKQKNYYIKNGCSEIEIFAQIESVEAVKNVTSIFLSPIFKTAKYKKFLGIYKFIKLMKLTKKDIVSLGGINEKNISNRL